MPFKRSGAQLIAHGVLTVAITVGIFLYEPAFADYTPAQNFSDFTTQYSIRNEFFSKSAFSFVATSTIKIDSLTFVSSNAVAATAQDVFVTVATGENSNLYLRHVVATSSTVTLSHAVDTTATTTVYFIPPLQFVPSVTITFLFHATNGDIRTLIFQSSNPSAYPAYVYDYSGSGIWQLGTVVSANYGASFFTTNATGTAPLIVFCALENPNCQAVQPVVPDCGISDIGACIGAGLAWAFYPSIPLSVQLGTLASTTNSVVPFGYVSDFYGLYDTISTYATTSFILTVELSPIMNWLGASYSSTTITVINTGTMKSSFGTLWTLMQNILKAIFWTMFLIYAYHRARKFL